MFNGCLNPQRIYNTALGEYIIVSCGHCEYCKEARRRKWADRLEHELKSAEYVIFGTLSYSNLHLPKICYDEEGFVTHAVVTKVREVYNRHNKTYKTKITRECIHDYDGLNVFTLDPETDEWLAPPHWVKQRNPDKSYVLDKSNSFAFCYRPDITNFFKRCRTNIKRHYPRSKSLPEFRYFAVSEYGPETFRPHFHVILTFSKRPDDESALLSILSESWSKSPDTKIGRQFEVIRDKTAAAKYVSKYVCKDASLPLILLRPEFSTFSSKSIAPPLGSESFPVSDIPAIFDKGTLLYDSEYYDTAKGCFVPVKRAFPDCAWQRVFPKLLGRRLLSNTQMRAVFKRIFDFKDNPNQLPNLIKEFPKKYPIGFHLDCLDESVIDAYISCYRGFGDSSDFPDILNYELECDTKKGILSFHKNLATFSRFFERLIPNDLDFFLFGIPKNRTFCRKILTYANQCSFLSTPFLYLDSYLRYETMHFTDTLRYVHEDYERLPNAYEFASIYTDFYVKLYPRIDDYDEDTRTRLDLILSSFNLGLDSFYSVDGLKIIFDFTPARAVKEFELLCKDKARKLKTLEYHNLFEDL